MKKIFAFFLLFMLLALGLSARAELSLPDHLTDIDDYAFYRNSAVSGVVEAPSGVTHIGTGAFGYTDIYALKIPDSCTDMESDILIETTAAYIHLHQYRALPETLTDAVSYIFVEQGMNDPISGKYVNMDYVVEHGGVYYLKEDFILSALCPVDRTKLESTLVIPKLINGMPVASLGRLVMPGCSQVCLDIPSYLNMPDTLPNMYYYQSYLSLPALTILGDPAVGIPVDFQAQAANGYGLIIYNYKIMDPNGNVFVLDEFNPSFIPEAAGIHILTVSAIDAVRDMAEATLSFMVRSNLTLSDPVFSGNLALGSEVGISVSVIGAAGAVQYEYEIDGPNQKHYSFRDTASIVYFTPEAAGVHTLTVKATDEEGSTDEITAQFTILEHAADNDVKYRALLIGNTYPGSYSALPGPDNDLVAMKTMLDLYDGSKYAVSPVLNATASEIRSAISFTFSGADSNDVSLFYYSGHGTSLGDLCGTGNTYVSISQLRQYLDQIPGTKIVLLDCCYSGAHINKSKSGHEASPASFNSAVISAFASAPKAQSAAAPQPGFSTVSQGNLATAGYVVMTACSKDETSYSMGDYINGVEFYYGAFTHAICLGSGYDMRYKTTNEAYADQNKDGRITLGECYADAVDTVDNYLHVSQSTQYYGNPAFILWFSE